MNKLSFLPNVFFYSPFYTQMPTPAADTCLCEAILRLWYYYATHVITIAFVCSQIQYKMRPISLYLVSERASFCLISKVLIVSF